MSFPASPTNNQQSIINGTTYIYSAASRTWTRTSSPLANLTVSGNITTSNVTISGNLVANGYANIFIATGTLTNRSALTIAGNVYGRGGQGYLDALTLTNTHTTSTNPNKWFRLNPTGGLEIVNSAYTTTIMSLSDGGNLSITGTYQVGGKQAVNGPAFSAWASATTTITSGSLQKVNFATEEFDTNNNFASSRFTPTVEGYYQLSSTVRLDGAVGTGECMIVIFKNGSEWKRGWDSSGVSFATNFFSMSVSSLVYANGTGDYFEIFVQQGSGGSLDTNANQNISWFTGTMVRGA